MLGAAALWAPAAAQRREARVPAIGFLAPGPAVQYADALDAMQARLRELGRPDPKPRFADWSYERLAALARELGNAQLDVIAVAGLPPVLRLLEVNRAVPIVMALVADPIEIGVVANIAGQGANLTGTMVSLAEVNARRVELLREALPAAKRIGLLVNPENPSMAPLAREAETRAAALGLELQGVGLRRAEQLPAAFDALRKSAIDALLVMDDPAYAVLAPEIGKFAAANRVPTLGFDARFAAAGALFGYGVDQRAMYRRSADYIDSILKGTRAVDLRLQRASPLELAVNLKSAAALGVRVPQAVVARAQRVI